MRTRNQLTYEHLAVSIVFRNSSRTCVSRYTLNVIIIIITIRGWRILVNWPRPIFSTPTFYKRAVDPPLEAYKYRWAFAMTIISRCVPTQERRNDVTSTLTQITAALYPLHRKSRNMASKVSNNIPKFTQTFSSSPSCRAFYSDFLSHLFS